MKKKTVMLFGIIGIMLLWSFAFVFMITFYQAFASPHKAIIININGWGEAYLEAIVFPIFLTVSAFGTINYFKGVAKNV